MFRSKEEIYTDWYLNELMDKGYVSKFEYEAYTFTLTEPVVKIITEVKQLKNSTKEVLKRKTLLHGCSYTPDFRIEFIKIPDCLINNLFITDNIWWIDVKGSFNGLHNTSAATFPLASKFLYDKHNILVQKFVPGIEFAKTFTPERFLSTDKETKERKIKWEIKKLM